MAEASPSKEEKDKSSKPENPGRYSPSADEQALIEKWKKRFNRAEEFLRPYRAKWLRMYKLYRAYQEKSNYAYQTRLMPPIAFQVVETVVSRIAVAKRKTRVLPRDRKDVESKAIQSWDDLVNYDFDAMKLEKKMPRWLRSTSTYGNGIAKVTWAVDETAGYDDPFMIICDLWDILPAPETEDLQDDCPWLIHRIIKFKDQLERDEKARGDNPIYKNLEFVQPTQVEDWKKERYELNQKKIGQIQTTESKETLAVDCKIKCPEISNFPCTSPLISASFATISAANMAPCSINTPWLELTLPVTWPAILIFPSLFKSPWILTEGPIIVSVCCMTVRSIIFSMKPLN